MSELKKDIIKKLARLARIELTEAEEDKYQSQLSSILDYAEKLNKVNTDGVEPTAHVTGLHNITRNDLIKDEKLQSDIVSQAPRIEGKNYKVKAVFDK